MSHELKLNLLPDVVLQSPQHQKLQGLIEKIEQQKLNLAMWKNAQSEIQSYLHQKLIPIYRDLHAVLFLQLEQLWKYLENENLSKADLEQLDVKLIQLAKDLKKSQYLNAEQLQKIVQVDTYYQQHQAHNQSKKDKKKLKSNGEQGLEREIEDQYLEFENIDEDAYENRDSERFQRERAEHHRKRLQQKREEAEKLTTQSLKTVYLKITAMIHPDREPDEAKKLEKTELQQVVNEAYTQQDLFYLLKLQLQLESNKDLNPKALNDENVKFYQMALEAQSQRLASQIDEITDSFHWCDQPKPRKMQLKDVYKVIDTEAVALKEQVKWERKRLKLFYR